MNLLCRYDGTYLIPASADSVEAWDKLNAGHEYTVEVKKARNPRFHRLGFGLLQAMFKNQERFDNFKDFLVEIKVLCGLYDEYITAKGEVVYLPRSLSFAAMDDLEFDEVYKEIKRIADKRFGHEFVEAFEYQAAA